MFMFSTTNNSNTIPTESFVTCIHTAKFGDSFHDVIVTWAKTLANHTLYISVEHPLEESHYTCNIDLKTWQFWGKKGLKTFKVNEKRVNVFWDLRAAKFTNSPEPDSDFYVAIVSEGGLILLLGHQEKEAYKKIRCRSALEDAWLVQKKEIVFAKKCFSTKTKLGQGKREHTIIIESVLSSPSGTEMWIGIDGTESIRVTNLHWRFRGNETIIVEDVPVHVLWDVHGWLYNRQRSGVGTFIFRQGVDESEEFGSDVEESEAFCKSSSCDMVARERVLPFCICLED